MKCLLQNRLLYSMIPRVCEFYVFRPRLTVFLVRIRTRCIIIHEIRGNDPFPSVDW